MTNYERISYLKKIGVWDDIVVPLTAKLSTLDRFFKIYSYINEHNSPKKREKSTLFAGQSNNSRK